MMANTIGDFKLIQILLLRVRALLQNPLSVVEYFHNMVRVIIEGVLKQGMFGELTHYYGTIEYQGRFTPHLHMAVSSSVFKIQY